MRWSWNQGKLSNDDVTADCDGDDSTVSVELNITNSANNLSIQYEGILIQDTEIFAKRDPNGPGHK